MDDSLFVLRIQLGSKQIEFTESRLCDLHFHLEVMTALIGDCETIDDFHLRWNLLMTQGASLKETR